MEAMLYPIRYARLEDLDYLSMMDHHAKRDMIERKIRDQEILVIETGNKIVGWLRYNLFWDNTPFMNLIWLDENARGKGLGTNLTEFWENEMRSRGYQWVMTSTLSNEQAQFFYRKRGYKDAGSLLLEGEPLEILFIKKLT